MKHFAVLLASLTLALCFLLVGCANKKTNPPVPTGTADISGRESGIMPLFGINNCSRAGNGKQNTVFRLSFVSILLKRHLGCDIIKPKRATQTVRKVGFIPTPATGFLCEKQSDTQDTEECMKALFEKNQELTYAYNDAVERNTFLSMPMHEVRIPEFEESRNLLPSPVWKGHGDVTECYWKAWEIAFSNLRNPQAGSGFVSPFIDTAFNGFLFMWDSAFITMFGKYGSGAFDFQKTLDNFYASQHKDGFICRELSENAPGGHFARHDPSATGPEVLTWSEWEFYQITADRNRLQAVFDPLFAYHRWMRLNHTWRDGTYWSSGWGCGMDNQPRLQKGYDVCFSHGHQVWVDACLQAVLDAKLLIRMAEELGRTDVSEELTDEAECLTRQINTLLWSEEEAFYYDLWRDGTQNRVKSVGAYWALLADVVPKEKLARFLSHLENPAEFGTPHPIPSLSADHPAFDSAGGYWRGGVWAPTDYMVLKGLEMCGENALAHRIACRHLAAVVETWKETGILWENYSPMASRPGNPAKRDFVGWTGLVPIAVLFEYVFGIHGDPVHRKIRWDVNCPECHGILNYPFGSGRVDLLCERRTDPAEKPKVTVRTDVPITLELHWNGKTETVCCEPNGI